jgi:hypothetical protein
MVALIAAHVTYELLRRTGLARLDRRSTEYLAHKQGASDP